MDSLKETVASGLATRFRELASALHDLAAPLSDEQFWAKPFGFGNSFGHLVLHVTGNLNYYIGAQMANTEYVRDRPLEFTDATRPAKAEVLEKFDAAFAMALNTIRSQSAEDWAQSYTAVGADADNRFGMVLACATHLHHHIGQMMYLGFALKQRG